MPDPPIGARVLVPLGKRTLTGVVLSSFTSSLQPPTSDIKPLIEVLDASPFLPPDVVALAMWVADYYACGVGEAIATAMPPRAWIESERHAAITDAGEARLLAERGARRDVLEHLSGGRIASVATLTKKAKGAAAILAGLETDGLVALTTPLRGTADASRTVRVAVLTAQGADETTVKLG